MARTFGVNVENNFSRGLVTEATGLNFPENAAIEASNVIFSEKAKVIRRLGIDYEDDYSQDSTGEASLADDAIVEYTWRNASNQGTISFVVVQVGAKLHFYAASDGAISAGKHATTIDLSTYEITVGTAHSTECQFASGDGKLFVVSENIEPIYVTYNVAGDTLTAAQINVKIRDFDGVDDSLDVDERPGTTPSTEHKYNLYNQGWQETVKLTGGGNDTAYNHWDTARTDWPSNADVWWKFKKDSEKSASPDNAFDPSTYGNTVGRGNTPAPKGHFILDAFVQDRDAASGLSGITDVDAGTRPSVVGFFAGRVWYGGVNADNFGSKLYFSQIAERKKQYGRCYQELDPTAEDLSDLLPSDGGVVVIPEMGVCKKMFVIDNTLFIFATNGIWAIAGSQGQGFRANDYVVARISSVGCLDFKSFVDVNGIPFWWNSEGIFTLQQDEKTQKLNTISITDNTIRSYYDAIPLDSKSQVKGVYNDSEKVIQWVFRSTTAADQEASFRYDRALCFNIINGAFYPYSFLPVSTTIGPFISGIIAVKGLGAIRTEENVTDSSVLVTDGGIAVYSGVGLTQVSLAQVFKYVTIIKDGSVYDITFSQELDETYTDWVTYDSTGVDFDSVFLTGYKVHGQGIRKFQTNYLRVYMDTEPNASLYVEAYWNYGRQGDSGQITSAQAYAEDRETYGVSSKRLKIRGSGLSLQLKFYSETGKPFTLIGWSGFEIMNNLP